MTDDLTASAGSMLDASPSSAPSSEDERIKGFQRALSAKAEEAKKAQEVAAALQARIEALELAQMPEAERASVLSQREQQTYRDALAELERVKLGQKYTKVAPHYETLLKAKTAEEQMQYLDALLNPKPAGESTDNDISDVDANNPMRSPTDTISLPPGLVNDEASADRILSLWGKRSLRG